MKHSFSDRVSIFSSISDLGFIFWKEDHYFSKGSYDFDGVNYTLDENLIGEFSTLYDSIVDIFDIQDQKNQHTIRALSYEFDFGLNYIFDYVKKSQVTINYNLKRLDFEFDFLHTATVSYVKYFQHAQLSLVPMYSVNRFNYTNVSLLLNKTWKDNLVSNLYIKNIFGMLKKNSTGMNLGLGLEVFLLF